MPDLATNDNADPTQYTTVLVAPSDLETVVNHGSVVQVTGTCGDERITFAGDHRSMAELLSAVADSGEQMIAWVADFQIQSVELEA